MYKIITLLEAYSNPNLWFEKPVVVSVHKKLGKLGNCPVCKFIYIKINTCTLSKKDQDVHVTYQCYSCDKPVRETGTFYINDSDTFFLLYNKVVYV